LTHTPVATLDQWVRAINRKGQAIIYGPPGTGKTFTAEALARHLVGGGNGVVSMVQFHPAYAYEDFIQGLRPRSRSDGQLEFELLPGRFMEFCSDAATRTGISVLIIDEINRANIAQVFGEMMYLLEYRDKDIPLAGGHRFRIPGNVRILGTMNTADRSVALVDHALRRRFSFIRLQPDYEVLTRYHAKKDRRVDGLVAFLKQLNKEIDDPHYSVGISFFMREQLVDDLEAIWTGEIEPYLEELFSDNEKLVDDFRYAQVRSQLEA
jgi:5-methylcytosine-specific restriction protein B